MQQTAHPPGGAGLGRGQLEARVVAGARARAAAPVDVSAELRATAQAETDARIMVAQAQVQGEDPAVFDQAAAMLAAQREGLDAGNAAYEAWSESTAGTREIAGKARKELERRGYEVPKLAPEDPHAEASEAEAGADEPETQAPEIEAPEIEASEPETSPEPDLLDEPVAGAA